MRHSNKSRVFFTSALATNKLRRSVATVRTYLVPAIESMKKQKRGRREGKASKGDDFHQQKMKREDKKKRKRKKRRKEEKTSSRKRQNP